MKKLFSINFLAVLALFTMMMACGNGKKENSEKEETKTQIAELIDKAEAALPNYRYVDLDSILSAYNLAKDYNEEMLRLQNNMQSEVKRHENSLQALATTIQNKAQNNGYLTQASFDADQKELADRQSKAQKAVASLQSNFENTAMLAQKTVNDSIEAFIQEYNAKKGYDAIFFKAATIYINPALDVTNEVIEGLNARYNKVKK